MATLSTLRTHRKQKLWRAFFYLCLFSGGTTPLRKLLQVIHWLGMLFGFIGRKVRFIEVHRLRCVEGLGVLEAVIQLERDS